MFCNRVIAVLLATLFSTVPAATGQSIWTPLLNVAAQTTCDTVQSILDVPKVLLECKCTASLTLTGGVTTRAVCALKSPVCIVSDRFCGKTEFDRYGLRTGLQSGEACLEITSGLGIPAWSDIVDFPELCITGTRNRGSGGFRTCNVTFAGDACRACSVCPSEHLTAAMSMQLPPMALWTPPARMPKSASDLG
jgi:hypothetical protein